MFIHFL